MLVTDRERVVAELVPPRAGRGEFLADAWLADEVRRGAIRPPLIVGGPPPPRKPVMSHDDLMEELRRDREDR